MSRAENSSYENETVEQKLILLAEKLKQTKGKKVYGYLNRNTKDLIDSIVDELAKDKTIAELYDLWYEKKYEILGTYSSKRPPKIPLSENQEFKSIKNAIIKEAMNLNQESNQNRPQLIRSPTSVRLPSRVCSETCAVFSKENSMTKTDKQFISLQLTGASVVKMKPSATQNSPTINRKEPFAVY